MGITLEQVEADLDMSSSRLARIELGAQSVDAFTVRALLDYYGASIDDRERLIDMARATAKRPWWRVLGLTAQGYVALEAEAVGVHNYEFGYVPGLLQTEGYARSLFEDQFPSSDVDRHLAIRINRRWRLEEGGPLTLHAIVNEVALIHPIGSASIMADQLRYLAKAVDHPNITLQMLPIARGLTPGLRGSFSLLMFPPHTIDDIGYHEHPAGSLRLPKRDETSTLRVTFTEVRKMALDETESSRAFARLADVWEEGRIGDVPWS
ncbi:helix-turn-helix protein [Herbihabitans rhizosphaerae]|uniref:Helix-turn-helix protein n=2 Tax=Herbihabitans rhizosphaerae TaxID=1872711 RepID=A0A4Q7KFP2_9PSEU|nr:helix-turn-helix protein [Herbihabitans rhizosphaerae]